MAKTPLHNVTILHGGVDLSGSSNSLSVPFEKPAVPTTNFASGGWAEVIGGIASGTWALEGFDEMPEPDSTLFGNFGGVWVPTTYTLSNPVVAGDVSYTQRTIHSAYAKSGAVGDAAKFSSTFMGTAAALRGRCLETVTATTSTSSAGQNVGAASATQTVTAVIHVLDVSGTSPTLDLVIESDGDDTWASATTRLAFTQITEVGWQVQTLAGAVTDTWWRGTRTVGGTSSPTFRYRLFLIIQ